MKNVHYQKLETEESEGEEDESPPTHVHLHNPHYGKGLWARHSGDNGREVVGHLLLSPPSPGTRWNHVEDLDEFFEQVHYLGIF